MEPLENISKYICELTHVIIRDYLTVFWLSPEVSTRDPLALWLIMVKG